MQKQVSEKVLRIAIIGSMLLWGLSWPSAKALTQYCSVVNFTVYRYIIVVITLLLMLLVLKVKLRVKKEGWPSLLMAGLLLALYSWSFYIGLKHGAAGAGGVLVTTMNPIMAYSLNILLLRKKPGANESMGLLLGLAAGAVLLNLWDNSDALLASGNLYFLLAACCWAVMSKFTSRASQYGTSLAFSLFQYLLTLLCLLPVMDVQEFKAAIHIQDGLFWLNLFFGSAIVTSIATTIYFYATTRLGAEKASSYIFMVPLAAAVSSWLLLGEQLQLHTIIGGAMGLAAVYLINRKKST